MALRLKTKPMSVPLNDGLGLFLIFLNETRQCVCLTPPEGVTSGGRS
jgi:hypothetical protein